MPDGRVLWLGANPNQSTWVCYFCAASIDAEAEPSSVWSLNVHHLDGDHDHNVIENLAGAHQRCHARYHMQVRLASGYREQISRAHRGKVVSAETRQRQSDAHKRRDPATKLFNVIHECECGMVTNSGSMARHRTRTGHTSRRIHGS